MYVHNGRKDVRDFLLDQCDGDETVARFIEIAIAGDLLHRKENLSLVEELPEGADPWVCEKWDVCGPWYRFTPDEELKKTVREIQEFFNYCLEHKEPWTKYTDAKERPKKLVNLGYEKTYKLAHVFNSGEFVKGYPDSGFILRLKSPNAFNRERQLLNQSPCDFLDKDIKYYTVRDKEGFPQALIQVSRFNDTVTSCVGRDGNTPDKKALPLIQKFIKDMQFEYFSDGGVSFGLIKQGKTFYDVFNLPPDFRAEGSIMFMRNKTHTDFNLPENLSVCGQFMIRSCDVKNTGTEKIKATHKITVDHNPHLKQIAHDTVSCENATLEIENNKKLGRIANNVECSKMVLTNNPKLTDLGDHVKIGSGGLIIKGCPNLRTLPDDIEINGSIMINGNKFRNLPAARRALEAEYQKVLKTQNKFVKGWGPKP